MRFARRPSCKFERANFVSWNAGNRVPNDAASIFVVGSQQISHLEDDRCRSATRTQFEARPGRRFFMTAAVLRPKLCSFSKLTSRTNRHIPTDCSGRCALQCSSLTVSTASACGDCNLPVIRTFLPRNFLTREILVNMYAWGLDSSVRKNIWLQSTIVPTTSRCPSASEVLGHPSAQSAIRAGAVAS
jgi:hypothetical protein